MANETDIKKLVEQIKKASNILVALSSNPSVDELASALGLTLMLNKNKKRAVSIFSGQVPSFLNFLKLEETFDRNVDGLRDFIITLDPDKADRLVCKVDEGMVKVFITPNNTVITKDDLGFTQGDYNVDLVIALGVKEKEDLDQALSAHGRILHNAFVGSISVGEFESNLGNVNLRFEKMSSYAEAVAMLPGYLDKNQSSDKYEMSMDEAVATALLTALVATTERFSNAKTTVDIMSLSADLMKAGANQQLIANELAKDVVEPVQAQEVVNNIQAVDLSANEVQAQTMNLDISQEVANQELQSASAPIVEAAVNQFQPIIPEPIAPIGTANETQPVVEISQTPSAQPVEEYLPPAEISQAPNTQPVEEYQPVAEISQTSDAKAVEEDLPLEKDKELVIEPDFSNLEEYSEHRLEKQQTETAQSILARLSKPNQTVYDGSDVFSAQLEQAQSFPTDLDPTIEQVSAVLSEPALHESEPQPMVQPLTVEEIQPIENYTTLGEVANEQSMNFDQAPVMPNDLDTLMPPPLPDFSNMSGPLPLPPVPPMFDQPAAPEIATVISPSENSPFNQVNQIQDDYTGLTPYQPQPQSTQVDSVGSPIMADQVYPKIPSDKSQFVIPE